MTSPRDLPPRPGAPRRSRRVLVTGGAGFIGRRLAADLVARGDEVVGLDLLVPQVHEHPEATAAAFPGPLLRADVHQPGALDPAGTVDAVIHLAARTGTGQSMYEEDLYERVNVGGTRVVARWAADRGIPLVLASSRAVYGEAPVDCPAHGPDAPARCCAQGRARGSREEDPHRPLSVYGRTKSRAEQVVAEECAGRVPSAILRPQNVVGHGQALHDPYTGVLAAFLSRLRTGRAPLVYGDGSQRRDLLHVGDASRMFLFALDSLSGRGAAADGLETPLVLNAGSGEPVRLRDIAGYAAAAAPGDCGTPEHVDVHRSGDVIDAWADMSRMQRLGGPMPQTGPAEAVADFIRGSWGQEVAPPEAWDRALEELRQGEGGGP